MELCGSQAAPPWRGVEAFYSIDLPFDIPEHVEGGRVTVAVIILN